MTNNGKSGQNIPSNEELAEAIRDLAETMEVVIEQVAHLTEEVTEMKEQIGDLSGEEKNEPEENTGDS